MLFATSSEPSSCQTLWNRVCVCVCVCKREREWEKDRQRRQTRGRPRDKGDVCLHLRLGVYMSGWVLGSICVFVNQDNLSFSLSEPFFREVAGESDVSWWWFFRMWHAACIDVRWDEWFRPSESLSAPPKAAATSLSKNCSSHPILPSPPPSVLLTHPLNNEKNI